MQVYVNCKLYSMQHAYIIFLYYTIPTLSDYHKQGYFNMDIFFLKWCKNLQEFAGTSEKVWGLVPVVCILFAGAIILIAVPRCHRFWKRGRGFLGFKEMYPVSWFWEDVANFFFFLFFWGGSGRLWSFWDCFFLLVEHMGVPTMSQH